MKENKFMVGEEEESGTHGNAKTSNGTITTTTTTSSNHKKQPVRHHVKRRSSGRVHVAKLAPMARANAAYTDSEADFIVDDNENIMNTRPVIRRSQSQRSLNRLSLDRKGFTALTKRKSTTHTEKPSIDKSNDDVEEEEKAKEGKPEVVEVEERVVSVVEPTTKPTTTTTTKTVSSTSSSNNPASLTFKSVAAPVEQTLNAVANTLVIPKKKIIPESISSTPERTSTPNNNTTNSTKAKKQPLRSQFLASSYEEPSFITHRPDFHMTSTTSTQANNGRTPPPPPSVKRSTSNTNMMSRTQQKLLLQKQQSQVDDETSPIHPRNMQKINKELEILSKENRCIKRYVDPMRASLIRCLEKSSGNTTTTLTQKQQQQQLQLQHPALNRLQLGASKQYSSTSTLPTMNGLEQRQLYSNNKRTIIPHLEQRQIAHRHHHLKSIALSRSAHGSKDTDYSTVTATTTTATTAANANANANAVNTANPLWNLLDRMFSAGSSSNQS